MHLLLMLRHVQEGAVHLDVQLYLLCVQGVGSYRSNSGRYDHNKMGADVEL
jgi:hypothetical protein